MNNTSPQKIYLHTDKENYFAGEKIWFKAYLVDGKTHRLYANDEPVYVELINPFQKTAETIRLRIRRGLGQGNFILRDTIPEGIYQIRAYTNWMKNSGTAFYFNQNLEIRNPLEEYNTTAKEARLNKKAVNKLENSGGFFQVGFFPEGGNLLVGIPCKVAFKATDGYGNGISIEGIVLNNKKRELVTFRSEYEGMGYFYLTPAKSESYTANIKFPDGSHRQLILPEALENNVTMTLVETGDKIAIKIRSNKLPSNDRPANEFILIGQSRGKIYSASSINMLDRDSILSVDPLQFPSGIGQFTLFNNRLEAIAERLYLINHNDFINFNITGQLINDSIRFQINPEGNSVMNQPFYGSVSVIIDDLLNESVKEQNIITELLLGSDLPGIIDNPWYYLLPTLESKKHADLLMLTHGWKRFIWEDVIQQKTTVTIFVKEQGITVQGRIVREIFEFPVKDADVRMFILDKYNDEYEMVTGNDGRFFFNKLDYEDTIDVRIVARKPGGGKNVLIQLQEDGYKPMEEYTGDFFLTTTSKIDMKAYRRSQAELAREEMNKREQELDSIHSGSIYGTPDFVLWGDDIPPGTNDVLDAMQGRIPGVTVAGDNVTIRGINTIMGNTEPLLLIDGVPTSFSTIHSIPVSDIDRIEILKGPSTAMFGSRGANGVIAIYTKHGMFMKKGEITFSMLGYHVVERFYSPSTNTIEIRTRSNELPLTLFWKPDITINRGETISISIPMEVMPDAGIKVVFEGITGDGTAGFCYTSFK